MATEKVPAEASAQVAATPVAVAPEIFDLHLDEFCRRLSTKKFGPELIGGFHHSQEVAGKTKSSESAFMAAFVAFTKQPA